MCGCPGDPPDVAEVPPPLSLGQRLADRIIAALRPFQFPKYRLLSPLVPPTGRRRARVWGGTMELDLHDRIQRSVYLGCYERWETRQFHAVVKPGGTVVDVGANVGYFTALASRLVGASGRVFSVEPNPTCYRRLADMAARLPVANVRACPVALGERAGREVLYEPPAAAGNLDSTMSPQPGARAIDVACRTLDDCLEEWGVRAVDLLKIDVEGYEMRVFRGARRALRDRVIRRILCEVNEHWLWKQGTSGRELMQFLKEHGFHPPALPAPEAVPPAPGHRNYLLFLDRRALAGR